MTLLLLSKIILSCVVTVLVMIAISSAYKLSTEKDTASWFKAFGGLVIVVGFVSIVLAVFISIWSISA